MRYIRKWDCAMCEQPVVYDSEEDALSCACGSVKNVVKDGIMKAEELGNFRRVSA